MKKILLALFILTAFALPSVTLAQTAGATVGATSVTVGAMNAPHASGSASCSFWDTGTYLPCTVGGIAYIFLTLAAGLMWLAGLLLNLAIYYGVIDFGHSLGATAGGGSGGAAGIGVGWGVLRDIGNIVLIFGFVFIGIATILGLENYGIKKSLPQLLLFAVLLNFSLLASQVVIDSSNLLSTAIYSNMSTSSGSSLTCGTQNAKDCFTNSGLAGSISSTLGIGTIFSANSTESSWTNISGSWSGVLVIIFSTIFVLIAAVVLFAAAIMMVIRIVVLAFLMVLSPIGFAGMALPPLHKYAAQWWSALLAQSFFVPVYLLLTLVGLKIGQGVAAAGGVTTGGFAAALAGTGSTSVFITFAIIIGFLIAALLSAKKLGAMGADFAIGKASSMTSGAFFGATGFVGRRTIGRGSNYLSKRFEKSEWLRRHPIVNSMAFRAVDAGAKATFDVRGSKALGGLAKAGGLDLGTASKSNYRQMEKDAETARLERSKRLQNSDREAKIIRDANDARNASQKKLDELEKKFDEAKASGIQKDIDDAKRNFEMAQAAHKLEEKLQNEIIDTYSKAPQVGVEEIKDKNGNIVRAGQKGYAQAIDEKLWAPIEVVYKVIGPGRAADTSAAKKIKAEAKKKKTEKDYDTITDLLKKAAPKP